MTRVVSLFLPTWSTDRIRRKPATQRLRLRRRSSSSAGKADGGWCWPPIGRLRPRAFASACPPAKAQALVADLVIQDADPSADAEALDRLALWMLRRYAPIVAADPPDGIVIDSTGADHLHGGEAAMLATLIETACRRRPRSSRGDRRHLGRGPRSCPLRRAAGADRRQLAARRATIASLPVAALRLSADMVAGLRVLGFDRVADLSRAAASAADAALRP